MNESKFFLFLVKFSFVMDHAFSDIFKKFFTNPKIIKISPYAFIQKFIILGLTFRSTFYFEEFLLVYVQLH